MNEEAVVKYERLVETIYKAGKTLAPLSHLGRSLEVCSLDRERLKVYTRIMTGRVEDRITVVEIGGLNQNNMPSECWSPILLLPLGPGTTDIQVFTFHAGG